MGTPFHISSGAQDHVALSRIASKMSDGPFRHASIHQEFGHTGSIELHIQLGENMFLGFLSLWISPSEKSFCVPLLRGHACRHVPSA